MAKLFFLSHSTKDQEFVKKIAKGLGKDLCWLYIWEAKAGESIFQFDRGIADSRIFVLFWSVNAASSKWVGEEIDQARIRLFRDKGFRLVVVILDDTPLPPSLAHRVYIDGRKGIDHVVKNLKNVKKELIPQEVFFGKETLKDYFQDRQRELDTLERLAFSDAYSGIMVLGPDGIGKTSLVKRAVAILFRNLTPIWVDLKVSSTPIRLLSSIARPLSIAVDIEEAASDPERFWRNKLLPEIAKSDNLFIVLDNVSIESATPLLEGQKIQNLIRTLCQDLAEVYKSENPNAILISRARPELPQTILARYGVLELGGLDKTSVMRALRYHLSYIMCPKYDSRKVELLAEKLRGYPLAISLVAMRATEQGIDVVLEDKSLLRRMFFDIAQELFSGLSISPEEKNLLILIAASMYPLNEEHLRWIYGENWTLIGRLAGKQLLDPSSHGYSLHGILNDYVLEYMATPKEIMQAHGKLANLFKKEWRNAPENSGASAQYGSLAYFHNISAGRSEEAKHIKVAYLEEAKDAAVELYRRGQYEIALAYLENARKIEEGLDPIYHFYYALCLSRLGKSEDALLIIEELATKFPRVARYHHALGTIQRRLRKDKEALQSFRRAVATASPQRKSVPLASLADVLCDMGEIEEAKRLSIQALELAPRDSWIVSTAVKVLEKSGDIDKALEILLDALRISPTDAHLHFRAGMILKQLGDFVGAKEHLERAISDPALSFSYTALADVYLQLGNDRKAEEILEKFPGKKWTNASYLSTKANILRRRGKFKDAEGFLKRALNLEPKNPVHYGGMAQLKFDQAKEAIFNGEKQSALIYIDEANAFILNGLQKDKDNEVLLAIRYDIDDFKFRIGLK